MMALGALVALAAAVAAAVVLARGRHGDASSGGPAATPGAATPGPSVLDTPAAVAERSDNPALDDAVARWRAAGIITPEQGLAIVDHERRVAREWATAAARPAPPTSPPRRIPVVSEALGYLGGILASVGLLLIVSRYWPDLALGGRLALSGITATALLGAGFAVPEETDPAFARLRWALWLAGTAAAGLTSGVAADGLGVGSPEGVALAAAGAVTVVSGALWRGRDRVVQQATALVGALVTAGTAMELVGPTLAAGLTVWIIAAVLVAAGLLRRTTAPLLTELVGFVGVSVGAAIVATAAEGPGILFIVATSLGVTALAVGPSPGGHADRTLAGVVGGLLLSQSLPGAIGYFAQGAGLATGLVVWVSGAALVFLGYRRLTRGAVVLQLLGGAALLAGAAVTGVQAPGFAPIFGLVTALGLLAIGTLPRGVLCSLFGSVGLLVNVPWAITRFFPGESRAPLLILVSGALIIGVALLLARSGDRFRTELRPPPTRDRTGDAVH